MLKIHNRNDVSLFRQVIGVLGDFTDIADQNTAEVFITDVRCHNLFALSYRVGCIQLGKGKLSVADQAQITRYNTRIRGRCCHGAHGTGVINDRADSSGIGTYLLNKSNKAAVCNNVHIFLNPVI